MNDLLQRGIALARAGKRAEARTLLLEAVDADERSEQAWLWLSGVLDKPDDIRVCLENVLAINPDNPQARQGLDWIVARYGPQAQPELAPTEIQTVLPSEDPEPDPEPESAPAPVLRVAEVPLTTDTSGEPDDPCPYCGAPASIGQRNCLRCKQSLMIRDQPRAKRSPWLTTLAALRFFDAATVLLAGLGLLALAVAAYQAGQLGGQSAVAAANRAAITIATIAAVVVIFAGGLFTLGRGLLRRTPWAYFTTIGLSLFSLLALLTQLGGSGVVGALANTLPRAQRGALLAASAGAMVGVIFQGLYLALAAASYRDYYGPLRRFQPSFKKTEHATHYNNGVAYKDRGMWYMAMREWEMAVSRAPFDLNYLHGLGLAYAQLGRFDQARAALDKALGIAPAHRQISESRALVEHMAAASSGKR